MKKLIFLILALSMAAAGQVKYELKDAPGKYSVQIEVDSCDTSGFCSGNATFIVRGKGKLKVNQEFKFQTEFNLWDEHQKPGSAIPYAKQGIVALEDYNFDGIPDLALQNGKESGYSGASYNIYIYLPATKMYVLNEKFSDLATGPYLGLFSVDRKRMVLRTDSKSGCCWHEVQEFKVVKDTPVKIYESTENASGPRWLVTTTKRLVNGKWVTKVYKERLRKEPGT